MSDPDEDEEVSGAPSLERSRAPVPEELVRAYATTEIPAISATARFVPEDFVVEEVPLYEASGEGEHAYALIEKRGIPTPEAIRRLSRALSVPAREIGYAGLKDARAVTRQTLSFPKRAALDLASWKDDALAVLSVKLHGNKLKVGHLRGNRFSLKLRRVSEDDEARARDVLARLARGAPNYFGLQRFGLRRNSHRLGLALVTEDAVAFLKELLASPSPDESPRLRSAREAFERGDLRAAREGFPPSFEAERIALSSLERSPEDSARAVRAIPIKWRRLYASALQSLLFNRYLTRRLDRMGRLEAGEIAFLHRNGAAFVVRDAPVEQARADALEISPSGPIFGALRLGFFLPRGCYATTVLEELTKRPVD
ncbi:tRNA pseudouridine(13) synthase TruD [bacterium]|nr:tRNA pseudouridine(13) synthase TruD [bacterium]